MQRADEKQQILTSQKALDALPTQSLNTHSKDLQAGYKVLVKGNYLTNDQFFLDNIVHQGKPGYYLLTPLRLENSEDVILVNRGWLPKTREGLPKPKTSVHTLELSGVLAPPRSKPVILGSIDQPISETPPLWYYMDIDYFQKVRGYSVLPFILQLAPSADSGFVRSWPKFEAKSGMHIGYAIQWFVFAFFALIGLVGINVKKQAENKKNNKSND